MELFVYYLALILTLTWAFDLLGMPLSIISVVAAVIIYGLFYTTFYWTIARPRRHIPGLVLCFAGSVLFSVAAQQVSVQAGLSGWIDAVAALWQHPRLYLAALAGAFLFFFVGVKVGTPRHVTMVVHCSHLSQPPYDDRELASLVGHMEKLTTGIWSWYDRLIYHRNRKFPHFTPAELDSPSPLGPKGPPWVWPSQYVIGKGGSLSWHVFGDPGTRITITLENRKIAQKVGWLDHFLGVKTRKYNPFHPSAPTVLDGVLPAAGQQPLVLSAAPAVVPGRGGYVIEASHGAQVRRVDPGGTGPRKD